MKKILSILLVCFGLYVTTSCTRSKKSCKNDHKKMKKMRKSGQIRM